MSLPSSQGGEGRATRTKKWEKHGEQSGASKSATVIPDESEWVSFLETWHPESLDRSGVPFEDPKDMRKLRLVFLEVLYFESRKYRVGHRRKGRDTANRNTSTPGQSAIPKANKSYKQVSSASASGSGGGKREKRKIIEDDDGSGDEERSGKRSQPSPEKEKEQYLACPFYKHDPRPKPWGFLECRTHASDSISHLRYELRGLRSAETPNAKFRTTFLLQDCADVHNRQHLKRKHVIPTHCPRCFKHFKFDSTKDAHLLEEERCSRVLENPFLDRISNVQWDSINKPIASNGSLEIPWYKFYNIIFEDGKRFSTIFIEDELQAQLFALEDLVDRHGPSIMEDLRTNNQIPDWAKGADISDLFSFLKSGLHIVIGRFYPEYRSRESSQGSSSDPRASTLDSGYISNDDNATQKSAESDYSTTRASRVVMPSASSSDTTLHPDDMFQQWMSSPLFTSWSYAGLHDWRTTIAISIEESQSDITLEWFKSAHWSMWMSKGFTDFHQALEQGQQPTRLLWAHEAMTSGSPYAQNVWHNECTRYGSRIVTSFSSPVASPSCSKIDIIQKIA